MVPPFLPSYKNTARSLVWAVSLRKIGSPLLIFIMFPLYTVANVIQDTHIKDYYVYIKSANTDQIAQLLDKEERVVVSDQMSESSIFSNWYKFMILGTVCLLVLAVLEIVIIVKRKKVS